MRSARREAIGALSDFEREHSERASRQRENRFRLFVDGVQDYAIFMLSPDGHVASWNKGAEGKPEREPRTAR
jgi:PAS domain-containing protein